VRAETRHSLKQDKFSKVTLSAAEKTVHWTVEHKGKLIVGAIVVLGLLTTAFGGWYFLRQQDQKASVDFGKAVRTLDTPIRPAGAPPQPDFPTFASTKERAGEAHKQFQQVVDNYPHTRTSEFARYFLGITDVELGNTAAAEKELKQAADSRRGDLAALAKFALASVYRKTGKDKDAIDLYKSLAEKPTETVSKATAQMELADLYQEKQQTQEARRILEQVQKENPNTQVASLASSKLAELSKQQ
jgi:predicted negative regulator of RcsB-dependent stress response